MEKAQTAMYGVISIRFDLNFLKFVDCVICNLYCLLTLVFLLYTNHVDSFFIFIMFQNNVHREKFILWTLESVAHTYLDIIVTWISFS